MKKIVAYGNPVYDVIATPQIQRFERVLSGCSTNACLALSYLHKEPILVGTVSDEFRLMLETELSNRKIGFRLYPSKETGGFSLIYDDRGDRELDIIGIAEALPVDTEIFLDADVVLIGPILNEIPVKLVQRIKSDSRALIFTDPQGLLRKNKGKTIFHERSSTYDDIARVSDVVKANELETKVITGVDPRKNPEYAVKKLHETGCGVAIVTLAEAGSIIFDGKDVIRIPPYSTNAIDPTGAGDTYAAGFINQYLETPYDLLKAGCFASAVASVMVENSGPVFPLTQLEAEKRMNLLLNGPLDLKFN